MHGGGRALAERFPDAWYAAPALVELPGQTDVMREETFAPILYVTRYGTLDEALALQNGVPQGLSLLRSSRPTCARARAISVSAWQ